jgi:hypothetical protein
MKPPKGWDNTARQEHEQSVIAKYQGNDYVLDITQRLTFEQLISVAAQRQQQCRAGTLGDRHVHLSIIISSSSSSS